MTLTVSVHMVCTQYAQLSGLWLFDAVPWVGLLCVIVHVFQDHSLQIKVTYFSFIIIDKQCCAPPSSLTLIQVLPHGAVSVSAVCDCIAGSQFPDHSHLQFFKLLISRVVHLQVHKCKNFSSGFSSWCLGLVCSV